MGKMPIVDEPLLPLSIGVECRGAYDFPSEKGLLVHMLNDANFLDGDLF
jgi:hypothetical protein